MSTLRAPRRDIVQPDGEWQDEPQPPRTPSTEVIPRQLTSEGASGGSTRAPTNRGDPPIHVTPLADEWYEDEVPGRSQVIGLAHVEEFVWKVCI
jgi:hypothetical protein